MPTERAADMGGSVNLNVSVDDAFVVRAYRRSVTPDRLAFLQAVRSRLRDRGVACAEIVPTRAGHGWSRHRDHLVEVERFVPATDRMNTLARVQAGLPELAHIHGVLRDVPFSSSADPMFCNYVAASDAAAATHSGVARIRSWGPAATVESALADAAEQLAGWLNDTEVALPRQVVHGDFWDNNVLFSGDDIVLVTDVDFAGYRPRVDDLALTLYFTSLDIVDLAADPPLLRELVDAYDSAADPPLSLAERAAIPLAMARQPLWDVAVWVAELDDEATARSHLRASAPGIEWARQTVAAVERLQHALVV